MREPTRMERRLMTVTFFEPHQFKEWLAWMRAPEDPEQVALLDQPDWEEIVSEELGLDSPEDEPDGKLDTNDEE